MDLSGGLEKIKDFLQQQKDVIIAYLYGSRAEGFAKESSDLDIAVFLDHQKSPPAPYGRGINLARQIEKMVKPLSADIRELNSASPFFCFQVLKTGQLLCSKDENQRAEFESKIRSKYFDQKGMYEEFYRDMTNRLKEGKFGVGPEIT